MALPASLNTTPAARPGQTWLVIPVHNRRETTLQGLQHVRRLPDAAGMKCLVVDCGSTDGTSDAIRRAHPEVAIIACGADVWWTGAIAAGMQTALDQGAEYVIWLNDDTLPEEGALAALRAASEAERAITGALCFLPGDTKPAYSGMRRTTWTVARVDYAGTELLPVDALHGNLVCVPAEVMRKIGLPDAATFPHAGGDLDYTLRARRAGVPVLLVGRARAIGRANLSLNYRSWLLSDVPVSEWWRQLGRPGSYVNLGFQWRFHRRHWGIRGVGTWGALLLRLVAITLIRTVVPQRLLRRWRGRRSAAWQHEERHGGRP